MAKNKADSLVAADNYMKVANAFVAGLSKQLAEEITAAVGAKTGEQAASTLAIETIAEEKERKLNECVKELVLANAIIGGSTSQGPVGTKTWASVRTTKRLTARTGPKEPHRATTPGRNAAADPFATLAASGTPGTPLCYSARAFTYPPRYGVRLDGTLYARGAVAPYW